MNFKMIAECKHKNTNGNIKTTVIKNNRVECIQYLRNNGYYDIMVVKELKTFENCTN